jgi:hypothetical protein
MSDDKDLKAQLNEKMLVEISAGRSYEALQYVQSFVARKKKHAGRNATSALVFYGANVLIQNNAPSDAGTLLAWFIEDGAGEDYLFNMEDKKLTGELYCDAQRLLDLLQGLSPAIASPVVQKIYGPVHKLVLKKTLKKGGPLAVRMEKMEQYFASVFEQTADWLSAYKAVMRLQSPDMERAARILDNWSAEGYATEKPMFFARAIIQLLYETKVARATDLLNHCSQYVEDTGSDAGSVSAALAVWHLAIILTNLASLPPRPRVDPAKIFAIIFGLYQNLLYTLDPKLLELLDKVGVNTFGVQKNEGPNPMAAMLSSMLAGSGPNGGLDMSNMMAMLNNLQGGGAPARR